jgi:putative ABC transport system permease protein
MSRDASSGAPKAPRLIPFLRPAMRADVEDELRFHLEERVRDLESRGLTPDEARAEARRQFGDVSAIRTECLTIDERRYRRARHREVFGHMWLDLKFAARGLRRSPAFTAMAAACIALGVGVTTTIFTAVRGTLLRPLPYRDGDRLVAIYARLPERNETGINISWPDYLSWRDQSRSFEQLGMWTWETLNFSGEPEAERVDGAAVTPNLFPLLGIPPLLGRFFTAEEAVQGRNRVVLLSHDIWKRRFAGDASIIGRAVTVDAQPYTVVGVMPPQFNFPDRGNVWVPYVPDEVARERGNRFLAGAIGRLKPGITVAEAQADLDVISRRLQQEYKQENTGWDAEVIALRDDLVGDLRRPLLIFLGAVGMVLLIACTNVANLMLVRGATRQREVALRVALGAARHRVVGQVLVESIIIALIGGVAGAMLSRVGVLLLGMAFPDNVPFYISFGVDAQVVVFTLVLTVITGLLLGLVPALRATRVNLQTSLKDGARGETHGRHRSHLRAALVVTEVALSLILLVSATLLLRSYRSLTSTELGFDEHGIISARVGLPLAKYQDREARRAFWTRLYERVAAVPGVEAVGSANGIPFSGWNVQAGMTVEGRPPRRQGEELDVHYQRVSPDYFRAIGVPLLRGRGFGDADRDTSAHVGLINESLVRKEFLNQDPLGKRIKLGGPESRDAWVTIIGVVKDFRHYRLPEPMKPALYFPQLASPSYTQTLVIRTTSRDPSALAPALRDILRDLDPDVPAYQVQTFEQVVSRSLWRQRLQGTTLGVFAALALVLAVVGIYGVISYTVAQRMRELGVRVALGASSRQVLGLVLGHGARLTMLGVLVGLVGALALTRVLARLLYGVAPTDLLTFTSVPLLLAAVAVVATWIPARRATKVDPVVAMRAE